MYSLLGFCHFWRPLWMSKKQFHGHSSILLKKDHAVTWTFHYEVMFVDALCQWHLALESVKRYRMKFSTKHIFDYLTIRPFVREFTVRCQIYYRAFKIAFWCTNWSKCVKTYFPKHLFWKVWILSWVYNNMLHFYASYDRWMTWFNVISF